MHRRTFLTSAAAGLEFAAWRMAEAQATPAGEPSAVSVDWLGGAVPLGETGISWGVPWPRGTVRKEQSFTLTSADGSGLPLQWWPLAYWPDGTLKWRFGTGGQVNSSPAIGANGTIYVGSDDGNLYAINPDGTLDWKFSTGTYVDSSPVIDSNGIIYFGSEITTYMPLILMVR